MNEAVGQMRTPFLLLIAFIITISQGQDLDLIWKAKALQAVEKLDSLTKIKKASVFHQHQIMLEMAYANIINPELKTIVKKKANGLVTYHLIMNFSADSTEVDLMDVAYQYDIKTEEYFGVRVDRLPKKWGVRPDMPGKLNGYMMFTNLFDPSVPGFVFNKSNPFDYQVIK